MPTNWDALNTDFMGATVEFPGLLAQAFALLVQNTDTVQGDLEAGNNALHGCGAEGTAAVLGVGSGLSVKVLNGSYWIDGRRHTISESVGYLVRAVPENQSSFLYLDGDLAVTAYAVRPASNPAGTCYLGECVAGAAAVSSVDDADCDRVASTAEVAEAVSELVSAVGIPYTLGAPLQTLVSTLMSGGSEGEDPVSWDTLQRTYGVDPTTVVQWVASQIAAHVTALHDTSAGESGEAVSFLVQRWNSEAVRVGRTQLLLCRLLVPWLFHHMPDCAWVVWDVSGDGTDAYDFVDRVNSTWLPA